MIIQIQINLHLILQFGINHSTHLNLLIILIDFLIISPIKNKFINFGFQNKPWNLNRRSLMPGSPTDNSLAPKLGSGWTEIKLILQISSIGFIVHCDAKVIISWHAFFFICFPLQITFCFLSWDFLCEIFVWEVSLLNVEFLKNFFI